MAREHHVNLPGLGPKWKDYVSMQDDTNGHDPLGMPGASNRILDRNVIASKLQGPLAAVIQPTPRDKMDKPLLELNNSGHFADVSLRGANEHDLAAPRYSKESHPPGGWGEGAGGREDRYAGHRNIGLDDDGGFARQQPLDPKWRQGRVTSGGLHHEPSNITSDPPSSVYTPNNLTVKPGAMQREASGDLSMGVGVHTAGTKPPVLVGFKGTGPQHQGRSPLPRNVSRDRASTVSSNRSSFKGSVLTFCGINYEVQSRKMLWSKPVTKTVLKDVSGIMYPGMNAIMGPTGSGKSSLLDVLAGRKDPLYMKGQVLIDGAPLPSNFKCISGYVVQDDIVMGTLTVRENLHFSAALRLPPKWTPSDKKKKVDEVIEELGLTHVANSKIGTELIRGVSGGERKRTNIGMELITDPPVLFLDEPTTGLDAFTAGSVMKTLKNLARVGRTIVFSIHQPKYSIYKLFDRLTLVCKGELVYHGPGGRSMEPINYFDRLGYRCEEHNNPPDFFMDILHGEVKQRNPAGGTPDGGADFGDDSASVNAIEAGFDSPHNEVAEVTKHLITSWKTSAENQVLQAQAQHASYSLGPVNGSISNSAVQGRTLNYATPFFNQLRWVCWRTALNLLRNPQSSIIQLAVYLFFAISIGVVYLRLDQSFEFGIQNRMGLFFFSTLQMIFVNLGAIEVFIKERVIFIHENSSGFYRVSAYFIAKIFCDMLPIKALPVVVFMPIVYWMAGLQPWAGKFFFFELILLMTTTAACGVAFFVSASVSVFGIANIILSIVYVFMMVFAGYLINLNTMAAWLSWCRYISIFRYGLAGLSVNELTDMNFVTNRTNSTPLSKSGNEYLGEQAMPYLYPWDLWVNVFGQGVICLVFCTLCYVQLRRINKYK